MASGVRDTVQPPSRLTLSDQVFGKEEREGCRICYEHHLICKYPTPNLHGVEDQRPKEHQDLALR